MKQMLNISIYTLTLTAILFSQSLTGNYQVDYIIPREVYEAELGKVESSIGTITNKGEKR